MKFIKSFRKRSNIILYKKKKLPVWAHPYKDLFHNDTSIISYINISASILQTLTAVCICYTLNINKNTSTKIEVSK